MSHVRDGVIRDGVIGVLITHRDDPEEAIVRSSARMEEGLGCFTIYRGVQVAAGLRVQVFEENARILLRDPRNQMVIGTLADDDDTR